MSRWTPDAIATLRLHVEAKRSDREIAAAMGILLGAAKNAVKKFDLAGLRRSTRHKLNARTRQSRTSLGTTPCDPDARVVLPRDEVIAWAREHAPQARTLGEVNAVRRAMLVPPIVLARAASA